LEEHHVAGRANDEEVIVVLCVNCHRKASARQLDAEALPPGVRPSRLEAMALAMRSLATFFQMLADACQRWAKDLIETVRALDESDPTWRTLTGMP
jgi:hypothetical protein